MRNNKMILKLALCMMSAMLTCSCISLYFSDLSSVKVHYEGSKNDKNVINPDVCFNDGQWIYYSSPYSGYIYKIKDDGSQKTLISNDKALFGCILLYNGSIYYINSNDNRLYKIKTSGHSKKKISNVKMETAYDGYFIYNDFIYYYNDSDEFKKIDMKGKVYDAQNERTISSLNGYSTKIYKGYFYNWKDDGIYRTNAGSLKEEKIISGNIYPIFEIYNNCIYFTDGDCKNIYQFDLNDMEKEKIIDGNIAVTGPDYDLGRFKVSSDGIYYIDYVKDISGILYKTDTDGTNKLELAHDASDFMTEGGNVYYFDNVDNGTLYRIKSDGSDRKVITNGDFTYFLSCPENRIVFGEKSESNSELLYGRLFLVKPNETGIFELN